MEQDYISRQPYIKVIREIRNLEKNSYKDNRNLYLYADKLVTAYREFSMEEVLDISFKDIQGEGGLLFVHTDHGVYSYTLESSPESFIKAFKNTKGMV